MKISTLILTLVFHTYNSKKFFLDRAFDSQHLAASHSTNFEQDIKNGAEIAFPIGPIREYFFTIANISVYDRTDERKKTNFVVLSIHKISTEPSECIRTKILVLPITISTDDLFENYKEVTNKNCFDYCTHGTRSFDIHKGITRTIVSNIPGFKTYKDGFLSFKTENFLQILNKNTNEASEQIFSGEWKEWTKNKYPGLEIYLHHALYKLQLNFSAASLDGFFLINLSFSLLSFEDNIDFALLDKTFVRVNKKEFEEVNVLIESFKEK